jgi:transcriptional regulator with XRE-family HTH domain
MTRADLASRLKLSSQAISALENGTSKQPSFIVGLRLAEALGVPPHELAGITAPVFSSVGGKAVNAAVSIDLTITSRSSNDMTEWRRQILEVLAVIPGIHVEERAESGSTAPAPLDGKDRARVSPSLDEFLTRIAQALEHVDRRLRALEGDLGDPKADARG